MSRRTNEIYSAAFEEPYRIAQIVGFKDFKEYPHNEWMQRILYGTEKVMTLQAHRGSFKTTALSVCVALMMVLMPSKTILLIRKTEDDILTFVLQVKNILQGDVFRTMVKELYGLDLDLTKSTSTSIDTNLNEGVSGVYQFDALSLTGSLTGKHADIVITDDIVTLKDRVSRAERQQTKRQYMELWNVVNRGGRIINTGTPWHKDDAFTLMGEIERYSIYDTGMVTKEAAKTLRASMEPSLFAANYELKHIADSDALFGPPNIWEDDQSAIHDGIGHIDAAYGGEDYTAFTVIKQMADGDLICFGKLWHKHVDDCLNEIKAYHEHYRTGTIHCETNADKGYLIKQIKAAGIPTAGYHEKRNKFIKISTALRGAWGRIHFLPETDPEYFEQILDYTEHAQHDDAPDSLATAVLLMDKQSKQMNITEQMAALRYMGF